MEKNELKELFKSSLVYFLIMQVLAVLSATFLIMAINPIVGFIIRDPGVTRDVFELIVFILLESVVEFLMFFSFFKNDKSLNFSRFLLSYAITFALKLIISFVFKFSSFVTGIAISLSGVIIGATFIDENILTMEQVPKWIYMLLFLAFEILSIMLAVFAEKLAIHLRKKQKKELLGNK